MKRITTALLLAFLTMPLFATDPINKSKATKTAIEGYDVVAYFTDGKAIAGTNAFQTEWQGATWRFASAAHRDEFAKNPRNYAPQYGGYCAFGVSRGYAVGIEPDAWHIVDGKLYLNYNKDVQKEWLKDIPGYVKKADENWPKILAE